MEPDTRATSGADVPRYLNEPQAVDVRCDAQGLPVAVHLRKRWRNVERVVDVWRIDDEWWSKQELSRLYVRVTIDGSRPLTLFRDMREATWWQQRY